MQIARELLCRCPKGIREKLEALGENLEPASDAYLQRECDVLNSLPGKLQGFDCPKCKNKGVVHYLSGRYICTKDCECMPVRQSLRRIRGSGLEDVLGLYTLGSFQTPHPWQKEMKAKAQAFLRDHDRKWFFAGGQIGAGKTHLCTAIVGEFLKSGEAARYMLWKDEAAKIKAAVCDEEYTRLVAPLKEVPVLYIDDFWKTPIDAAGNKKPPPPGDINLAFEILNARYIRSCVTLISCEHTMGELLGFDEAVGSRIYQRTKGYCFNLQKDPRKNYRIHGDAP